ncbi:hypothetical protein JCM6882_006956 [Rhodosporidiobolus microsporus]
MSVLSEAIKQVQQGKSRTTRIHLIWVIQHLEQSAWILSHLASLSHRCASLPPSPSPLELHLSFHPTRGPLTLQQHELTRTASRDLIRGVEPWEEAVTAQQAREGGRKASLGLGEGEGEVLRSLYAVRGVGERVKVGRGRPDVGREIRERVEQACGRVLVVSCGPTLLTDAVRTEVAHLKARYPVELDLASYEY